MCVSLGGASPPYIFFEAPPPGDSSRPRCHLAYGRRAHAQVVLTVGSLFLALYGATAVYGWQIPFLGGLNASGTPPAVDRDR